MIENSQYIIFLEVSNFYTKPMIINFMRTSHTQKSQIVGGKRQNDSCRDDGEVQGLNGSVSKAIQYGENRKQEGWGLHLEKQRQIKKAEEAQSSLILQKLNPPPSLTILTQPSFPTSKPSISSMIEQRISPEGRPPIFQPTLQTPTTSQPLKDHSESFRKQQLQKNPQSLINFQPSINSQSMGIFPTMSINEPLGKMQTNDEFALAKNQSFSQSFIPLNTAFIQQQKQQSGTSEKEKEGGAKWQQNILNNLSFSFSSSNFNSYVEDKYSWKINNGYNYNSKNLYEDCILLNVKDNVKNLKEHSFCGNSFVFNSNQSNVNVNCPNINNFFDEENLPKRPRPCIENVEGCWGRKVRIDSVKGTQYVHNITNNGQSFQNSNFTTLNNNFTIQNNSFPSKSIGQGFIFNNNINYHNSYNDEDKALFIIDNNRLKQIKKKNGEINKQQSQKWMDSMNFLCSSFEEQNLCHDQINQQREELYFLPIGRSSFDYYPQDKSQISQKAESSDKSQKQERSSFFYSFQNSQEQQLEVILEEIYQSEQMEQLQLQNGETQTQNTVS